MHGMPPEVMGCRWSRRSKAQRVVTKHREALASFRPAGCSRRGSGCVSTESPRGNRTAESRDGPGSQSAEALGLMAFRSVARSLLLWMLERLACFALSFPPFSSPSCGGAYVP